MGWACGAYGCGEGVYRILVGKPEGRRPLGRPRCRWMYNIRTDLQEVGCGYMDWIGPAQDRDRWRTLVSAVMNLRVPWNAGNFLTSCKPVSFSRRTLHHGLSNTQLHQSRLPRGLRRWSVAVRLLRSRVRIPPGAWMSVVNAVCCQVEVSVTNWWLVQRSPNNCGASFVWSRNLVKEEGKDHWGLLWQ